MDTIISSCGWVLFALLTAAIVAFAIAFVWGCGYLGFRLSTRLVTERKHFYNILKGGFREHNRLHIAAMAMQALLSSPDYMKWRVATTAKPSLDNLSRIVAHDALRYADALVAEAHKSTRCLRLKSEEPHEYQL